MGGNYSLLAQLAQKRAGEKHLPKSAAPGSRAPAPPGTSRASLGANPSRQVASRNPDTGENRERVALAENPLVQRLAVGRHSKLFTSGKARAIRSQRLPLLQALGLKE